MNLKLDNDSPTEPFPVEYENVKAFIFMALTEKDGRYVIESYHGYGEVTDEERDNPRIETLVKQFHLYWQDARMWLKEIKSGSK